MKDSNFHLTTTKSTGWTRCLLLTSFDERRVRLDPSIVARTGFWLSFFRFQGATTHTSELGGVKYTISGFLRRICGWVTPATGMPTLSARSAWVQMHWPPSLGWTTMIAPSLLDRAPQRLHPSSRDSLAPEIHNKDSTLPASNRIRASEPDFRGWTPCSRAMSVFAQVVYAGPSRRRGGR
jgi:hypothetical protein